MDSVWITPVDVLDRTAVYRFEKTVNATKKAVIELNISADTRYRFYVNGRYVCEGPCQSDHFFWRYETVKVPASLLKDGENLLSFEVLYIKDECFYTQVRKDKPALLVFGTLEDGERKEEIVTSPGWKCFVERSRYFVNRFSYISMPHTEEHTCEPDTQTETVACAANNIKSGNRSPYGVDDKYILEKREIALLKPGRPAAFTELKRTDTSAELDAGVYTTAYPKFVFRGKKGGKIRFTYAECYCQGGRVRKKGRRDLPKGEIIGLYDEITFDGRKQEFTPYYWRAFRYVKAEFPEGTEFEAKNQKYSPYFYPIEEKGYIKTSDNTKNKLWEVSLNTLRCCTHESFVDCPYYEQCQYDMDSALEMMFMFRVTNDYSMSRKAVYDLARSQQPDGMLLAHYPATKRQVIPTFSLYWILMLRDYVTYSGDLSAAKELMPVADGVLNAFDLLINENGLVGATKYWHYTDWVPGWERGVPPHGSENPLTLSSMIYSAALEQAASLAEEIGRTGLREEYLKRREAPNKALNRHCYNKEKRFYEDVPGFGGYSEHTAVWAVLCGAVTGSAAEELIDRSFALDVNRASFSFNFYTFRALEKAGRYKQYAERLFTGWYKMLKLGCTTWCENPDDPRSECHAWSAAPIYEYSAMFLGVKPAATGFKEAVVTPDLTFADRVDGAVPTPEGIIKIHWVNQKGRLEFSLKLPKGVNARLKLPGKDSVPVSGEYRYSGNALTCDK